MSVIKQIYGELNSENVYKYTITNASGASVSAISYGATLTNIFVPDRNGKMSDVLVGFDDLDGFLTRSDYQGMTVGPYANRIGSASFAIDGEKFNLTPNENGTTTLHSCGELNTKLWNAEIIDENTVKFTVRRIDGTNGYPGNIDVSVMFTFDDDNELKIEYLAVPDRKTFINLTNHAYFNLAGFDSGTILKHKMKIYSRKFTAVDEKSIPTGELMNIENTPFDFSDYHEIGERIEDDFEQLKLTGGYDHNFCIDDFDGTLCQAASCYEESTGRQLDCFTTLPGVQFYAGNFLKGLIGKNNLPIDRRTGFCLETQFYPDSPNNPTFPSCLFDQDKPYKSTTVYKFSVR